MNASTKALPKLVDWRKPSASLGRFLADWREHSASLGRFLVDCREHSASLERKFRTPN